MGNPKLSKMAILTSGGDAPGMNTAIRSFVRTGIANSVEMYGIQNGYQGLLKEKIIPLKFQNVGLIINQGGTFIKTSRSKEFRTIEGRQKAADILKKFQIDAICVVGGEGSFRGVYELSKIYPGKVVGIPATIDNDIAGSEYSIGFETAVETAVDAIDKIRDTAKSHERLFLVEVMGRFSGQIALSVALASGAEDVLIPEEETNIDSLVARVKRGRSMGKRFGIIVVAEGDIVGGAFEIANKLKEKIDFPIRVSVLGHIQRGGKPTSYDRIYASKMGKAAFDFLLNGKHKVFTGVTGGKINPIPLEESMKKKITIDPEILDLIRSTAI